MKRRQYWRDLVHSVLGHTAEGLVLQRLSFTAITKVMTTFRLLFRRDFRNPVGVATLSFNGSQSCRYAQTLGFVTQPLRGCCYRPNPEI